MYKYLPLIFAIFLIACGKSKSKQNYPIPNKKDINEIVEAIIIYDSLELKETSLSVELSKIKILSTQKITDKPFPPNAFTVNISELTGILSSGDLQLKLRYRDSSYLLFQNNILKSFKITINSTVKLTSFNEQKKRGKQGKFIDYFDFSIPLFSLDQQTAYVQINNVCSGLCGYGAIFILKKIHSKWTVVERFTTWIS